MEPADILDAYYWNRLPLILMFVNGYFIYRLFVVTQLTDVFVSWSLRRSRGRIGRISLYIIATAAVISFFIPNAVTILILLPSLKLLDRDIRIQTDGKRLTTALTLSAIYGANIGGMGSLIGSPANLMLIAALDLFKVPGGDQITFLNWFLWSLPLVAIFSLLAWRVVILFGIPKELRSLRVAMGEARICLNSKQRSAAWLFGIFIIFWIILSLLESPSFGIEEYLPIPAILFFLLFLYMSFVSPPGPAPRPLLRPKDVFTDLPARGLLFIGLLVVIVWGVRKLGLQQYIPALLSGLIHPGVPPILVVISVSAAVTFLTEILSNTVVSAAFFPLVEFIGESYGLAPLILMIAVSAASTCAFMTPVATPCNALAFGEMKGTSLKRMLVAGFLLNLTGALLISLWLGFMIPLLYLR